MKAGLPQVLRLTWGGAKKRCGEDRQGWSPDPLVEPTERTDADWQPFEICSFELICARDHEGMLVVAFQPT